MINQQINLIKYLNKGANIIFHVSFVIVLVGYILDILTFSKLTNILIFINIATIILILTLFILFHLQQISLKTSFGIILYSTIANIFIETFSDPFMQFRLNFLMRDAIFVIIVLSLASLVINKIHSVIIAAIYLICLSVFTIITQNIFLKDSIVLIVLIVAAYACVVYYFVSVIEKAIATVEEDSSTIKEQNDTVSKSYDLLLIHQQKIEKQSEELVQQSNTLHEQSDLLHKQNEELNKLVATKNKFFSILAHDLKNPFNTILGFTDLLDARFAQLDDKKKKVYITNIKTTASKTYNLLESLLLWARTQSDSLECNPQNFAIIQLVEAILPLFENVSTEKKLKIIVNIDEKCKVHADIDHIEIILRNLISNAFKYTGFEGTISLDYKFNGSFVEILLTDSGIGMNDDDLLNLFRIDKERKKITVEGESGSGLGLIICNELIKRQGGALTVNSTLGFGSTFTLLLPKAV